MVFEILRDLFARSGYLHSAGTGDEMGISMLLTELVSGNAYLDGDVDSRILDILAGALSARALVPFQEAYAVAEEIMSQLENGELDLRFER